MSQDQGERRNLFPTTDWSLVDQDSRGISSIEAAARFDQLMLIYLPSLRSYMRITRRCSVEEADETVQEFVATKLMGTRVLMDARRERGRFRAYLLTIFQRHLTDVYRRDAARERGQQRFAVEAKAGALARREVDPFDIAWARSVLTRVSDRMRDHLLQSDRALLWRIFEDRVLVPTLNGTEAPPYQQMVEQYGFESATQACSAVVTGKRMFARLLREVIGEYAMDEPSIDEELNDLRQILGQAR